MVVRKKMGRPRVYSEKQAATPKTFIISEQTDRLLDQYSRKLKMSRSQVVNAAVLVYTTEIKLDIEAARREKTKNK